MSNINIIPHPRGYYELWINGHHAGNFDSPEEAKAELKKLQLGEED